MPAFAGLEDHAHRMGSDHLIRQDERGSAPADLQRTAHAPGRRLGLQGHVHDSIGNCAVVQLSNRYRVTRSTIEVAPLVVCHHARDGLAFGVRCQAFNRLPQRYAVMPRQAQQLRLGGYGIARRSSVQARRRVRGSAGRDMQLAGVHSVSTWRYAVTSYDMFRLQAHARRAHDS